MRRQFEWLPYIHDKGGTTACQHGIELTNVDATIRSLIPAEQSWHMHLLVLVALFDQWDAAIRERIREETYLCQVSLHVLFHLPARAVETRFHGGFGEIECGGGLLGG